MSGTALILRENHVLCKYFHFAFSNSSFPPKLHPTIQLCVKGPHRPWPEVHGDWAWPQGCLNPGPMHGAQVLCRIPAPSPSTLGFPWSGWGVVQSAAGDRNKALHLPSGIFKGHTASQPPSRLPAFFAHTRSPDLDQISVDRMF